MAAEVQDDAAVADTRATNVKPKGPARVELRLVEVVSSAGGAGQQGSMRTRPLLACARKDNHGRPHPQ